MKFSMRSCSALRQLEEIPPDLDPCIESCNSVTTRRKTVRADMRRTIAEEDRRGSFSMYSEAVDAHEPFDVWKAEGRIMGIENWPDVENTELAERTCVGVETVEAVREVAGRRIVPLDKVRPGSDGHDSSWHSFVADGSRSTPEDRAIARVDCAHFLRGVPPDVASTLVRNRLIGEELEGIAGELGITRSALSMRISRVTKASEFEAYS